MAACEVDLERAQRREQPRHVALVLEDVLQRAQHDVWLRAGDRERAPRSAQADADRRFVGAVAADVADQHVDATVLALH